MLVTRGQWDAGPRANMKRASVRATAGLSMVVAAGAEAKNRRVGRHLFMTTTMLKRVTVGLIPSMGIFILVGLVGLKRRFKKQVRLGLKQ